MSNHTKGNWHAIIEPHQAVVIADPANDGEGYIIAEVFSPLGTHGFDAHLIAAAPELLTALKEVLAAWTYEANQGDGIDEEHDSIYEKAKKLILKIEGGKQ